MEDPREESKTAQRAEGKKRCQFREEYQRSSAWNVICHWEPCSSDTKGKVVKTPVKKKERCIATIQGMAWAKPTMPKGNGLYKLFLIAALGSINVYSHLPWWDSWMKGCKSPESKGMKYRIWKPSADGNCTKKDQSGWQAQNLLVFYVLNFHDHADGPVAVRQLWKTRDWDYIWQELQS